MAHYDVLQRFSSTGSNAITRASPFHVYLWPYDAVGTTIDTAGFTYYRSKGMNFTRDFYDISGSGAFNYTQMLTGGTNSVDYWASRSEWAQIDLWWIDNETSYYDGTAANAARCINDITSACTQSKAQWATHHATPFYFGIYSNSCGINKAYIGYNSWLTGPATVATTQANNDACGKNVAAAIDFMVPENYAGTMDAFTSLIDWFCNEKARMAITTKLIPMINRGSTSSYAFMRARLEYMFAQAECDGVMLWGTDSPAAGPTYYDGAAWMQATLDFCTAHSITAGTPF